jgi:hypothetical protein
MKLYYIYFLPNEPKVGMTSRNGSSQYAEGRLRRVNEQKHKRNIDGLVWIAAALTKEEARRIEKEYQIRYNCVDDMSNPIISSKQAAKTTGRKNSPEAIERMKQSSIGKNKGQKAWNAGRKMTPDELANHAWLQPGFISPNKGKPSKLKGKPVKQITCPHCNKTGGYGAMLRHHLDNCKHKL